MIVIKVLQLELSYDYKIIQVIVTLQMMTGKERGNMVIHGLHHLPASIIFLKGLGHSMSIDSVYLLPLSSV